MAKKRIGEEIVIVKKVRAYPIPATVEVGANKKSISIVKLVMVGFWAEMGKTVLLAGKVYKVEFELPASHHIISADMKVMKTMDKVAPGGVQRLAELQFVDLSELYKDHIRDFIRDTKQKA